MLDPKGLPQMLPPEKIEVIKAHRFRGIVSKIGLENFHDVMQYMYRVLGMSTTSIGNLINKSDETIADWLRRLQIEVKPHKYKIYARLGKQEGWQVDKIDGEYVRTHVVVPDENLVRLIFFVIGDGSVGDHQVHVYQAEKRLFPVLQKRMERYGTVFVDFYKNGKRVETLEEADIYRLTLNRTEIARLIAGKHGLRFDTIQFSLANAELAACAIASLWDSDGSVTADKTKTLGFRAEITQSHAPEAGKDAVKLLRVVKEALEKHWGIRSKLRFSNAKPTTRIYEKLIRRSNPRRYILHIAQHDLPKFVENVGVHLEHHKKKARILKIVEQKN